MRRVTVHIGTTEGPAAVQRITAEDADVRSVVCLAGKAIALPISGDYDMFVRRPTGVIQACFGHGSYRVDIAEPICSGLSWQLGLFLAHALADERRLSAPTDKGEQAVWATGEVTRDLAVEPVREVALKLRRSEALFRALLSDGTKIMVAVPAGNLDEAEATLRDLFGDDRGGIRLVSATAVSDVLRALSLRCPPAKKRLPRPLSGRGGGATLVRTALYGASLALSLFAVGAGWHRFDSGPVTVASALSVDPAHLRPVAAAAGDLPRLSVEQVETRPGEGRICAEVVFDVATPVVTRRPLASDTALPPIAARDLCDLRYRVTNRLGRPVRLWVLATRDGGARSGFRLHEPHIAQSLSPGATLALDARPSPRLAAPLRQNFLIVSAPSGGDGVDPDLAALLDRAGTAASATALATVVDQARRRGAAVFTISQRFDP